MDKLFKQHRILVLKYLTLRIRHGAEFEAYSIAQTLKGLGRADNKSNRALIQKFWATLCPDLGKLDALPDVELRHQLMMRHKRMFEVQEAG